MALKQRIAAAMEWIRPVGISVIFFLAYYFGDDPAAVLHIMAPFTVMLMAGTIAFESLILGETASEKIGYTPSRAYQIQSGLNNLATAMTAAMVFVLDWGKYADATVLSVYLAFQLFSGINHGRTIITEKNCFKTNMLRPVLSFVLLAALVPHIVMALR